MKLLYTFSLVLFSLFILGCASSSGTKVAEQKDTSAMEESSSTLDTSKTAYEGSTGTGLLMERYKSGQIEGYRE